MLFENGYFIFTNPHVLINFAFIFCNSKAKKSKNVVTLKVNTVLTHPGIGDSGVTSADTDDPLYIGGVPGKRAHYQVWDNDRETCHS